VVGPLAQPLGKRSPVAALKVRNTVSVSGRGMLPRKWTIYHPSNVAIRRYHSDGA
jgi:hypothetical protein